MANDITGCIDDRERINGSPKRKRKKVIENLNLPHGWEIDGYFEEPEEVPLEPPEHADIDAMDDMVLLEVNAPDGNCNIVVYDNSGRYEIELTGCRKSRPWTGGTWEFRESAESTAEAIERAIDDCYPAD